MIVTLSNPSRVLQPIAEGAADIAVDWTAQEQPLSVRIIAEVSYSRQKNKSRVKTEFENNIFKL